MLEDPLAERGQPGPGGLVFVNARGNSPHLSSFRSQTWRKACDKVGRPELLWHDLRHTYAALRIANGDHPRAIQVAMGHSSVTVTMDVYGHLFESIGADAADALDATYRAALEAPKPRKVSRIA